MMKTNKLRISTNPQEFDFELMHQVLSQTYWAKNIPFDLMKKAVLHSLSFALFDEERQVGFARVVTDQTTFAYLADVFVVEAVQGQGLGQFLMHEIMAHPSLQGLRRFLLTTADAHTLYSKFGFSALQSPESFMEINVKNIYMSSYD